MIKNMLNKISFFFSIVAVLFSVSIFLNPDYKTGARTDDSGWDLIGGNVYADNSVSIGTSTSPYELNVWGSTTTVLYIDTTSTSTGSCLKLRDSDGGGFTYLTWLNGTQTATTTACR